MRSLLDHRRVALLTGALFSVSGGVVVAGAIAAVPRASKTEKVTERVVLKMTERKRGPKGAVKFKHAGRASGTLSGPVTSKLTLTHGVKLDGTVTITTGKGTLTVEFDGRARSLGPIPEFTGKAKVIRGTGRYLHAHGGGDFTGTVRRSNWAATIHATGSYTY